MNRRLVLAAAITAGSVGLSGAMWSGTAIAAPADQPIQQSQQQDQAQHRDHNQQHDQDPGARMDRARSTTPQGAQHPDAANSQQSNQDQQSAVRQVLAKTADVILTGDDLRGLQSVLSREDAARLDLAMNSGADLSNRSNTTNADTMRQSNTLQQSGTPSADGAAPGARTPQDLAEQSRSLEQQSHNQDRQAQANRTDQQANQDRPATLDQQATAGQNATSGQNAAAGQDATAGRNTMGSQQAGAASNQDLRKQVQEFQQNWKQKYDKQFNVSAERLAMANFRIDQGDLTSAAQLAGERTTPTPGSDRGPAMGTQNGERSAQPGAGAADGQTGATPSQRQPAQRQSTEQPGMDHQGMNHSDTNRSGMNQPADQAHARTYGQQAMPHVTVTVPESHGLQEAQVLLTRQGDDWKIDVPDTLSADQLRAQLTQQIRQLNSMKDQWPDNADEASALATHCVLLALSNSAQGDLHQGGQSPTLQPGQADRVGQQPGQGQQTPDGMTR